MTEEARKERQRIVQGLLEKLDASYQTSRKELQAALPAGSEARDVGEGLGAPVEPQSDAL